MAPLRKEVREALTRALADAFPSYEELDQLTQFKLDQPLNAITPNAPLLTLALRVVNWVEAHDQLMGDLVAGALNQNPNNSDLRAVAQALDIDEGAGEFEAIVFEEIPVSDVELWREDMIRCERAVCRIEVDGTMGTGFLIGPQQVLTARHVVQTVIDGEQKPSDVIARFDYKLRKDRKTIQKGVTYSVAPGKTWLEKDDEGLDFALLRLARKAADETVAGQPGAPKRGFLTPETSWKFRAKQPLFIIQHPSASPLKYAAGAVTDPKIAPHRVAHNVTTEPGSSGSPAFSSDWKPIGMHHWGSKDHNRIVPIADIMKALESPAAKKKPR